MTNRIELRVADFLFAWREVGDRVSFFDRAFFRDLPTGMQECFRQQGFSRVARSDKADVADIGSRIGHELVLSVLFKASLAH